MTQRENMADVGGRSGYFSPARVLQVVALTFAAAAALAVLFLPGSVEVTQTSDGRQYIEEPTLFQTLGPRIFVTLLIPLLLTCVPLLFSGRGWKGVSIAATVGLAVFSVIGSASIGWFYLPALVAAVAALFLSNQKRGESRALP
jgi:uncharacterized membrane protein